jgi:hypothetical protein
MDIRIAELFPDQDSVELTAVRLNGLNFRIQRLETRIWYYAVLYNALVARIVTLIDPR